jgi:hypothetical protein
MLNLINGFHVARVLYVAAKLHIADLVKDGPRTCQDLAAQTGVDAPSLYRVMRVLVSAGVFKMDEQARVSLNPLAETLLDDAPGSLRGWAVSQLGDDTCKAWNALLHSVRTGGIAFEHVMGCDTWTYRAANPASAKDFDEGMSSFIGAHNQAVVANYPFDRIRKIVDVGGGDGTLLCTLLAANPAMHGVLFEQPRVLEKAKRCIAAQGLTTRCDIVAGDMFEAIPPGGDAYILSRVLHDWDDQRAIAILKNCRKAMAPEAKLLLVERVIPARIENSEAMRVLVVSDLHMMVMNGGRERTEAQYGELCAAAGLNVTRVIQTGTAMSIVEAVPG